MFLQYYRLREQPFGVTPDPRFLYPSAAHREALASLIYSFESELGFSSLIAEPGLGKTTLLYSLLERFGPVTRNAYIFETQCDSRELLRHILSDLGCEVSGNDMNAMFRAFRDLVAQEAATGHRALIIIDESQNLGGPALETVRLLSNFETQGSKLVHIVLAGQPQLASLLARPELAQLRQRITIAARLRPFSSEELSEYIDHRLRVAGHTGGPVFTPEALELVAQQSGGIPREINRICFNAMSLGFALERPVIGADVVQEAGADLDLGPVLAVTRPPAPATPPPVRPAPMAPRAAGEEHWPYPFNPTDAVSRPEQETPRSSPTVMTAEQTSPVVMRLAAPTMGSAALRAAPARIEPESVRPRPRPVPLRPAASVGMPGADAERPERVHIPLAGERGRTISKYAVLAAAVLLALVIVLVFRGPLRSSLSSRQARSPATSPSQTTENRAPTAATAVRPGTAAFVQGDNTTDRGRTAVRRSSPVTRPASNPPPPAEIALSSGQEQGSASSTPNEAGAPAAMEIAPRAESQKATPQDSSAAAPPQMTVTSQAAAMPVLPPIAATDVARPIPANNMTTGASAEQISPGRLLTRVEPRYPAAAREAHLQGSVVLAVHIGKDGRVAKIQVVRGNGLLAAAAADAVRKWVYTPFTLNGQAVEVDTNIVVNFAL